MLLPLFTVSFCVGLGLGLVTDANPALAFGMSATVAMCTTLARRPELRAAAALAAAIVLGFADARAAVARVERTAAVELPPAGLWVIQVSEGPRAAVSGGALLGRALMVVSPRGERVRVEARVQLMGLETTQLFARGDEIVVPAEVIRPRPVLHEFAWDGARSAQRNGLVARLSATGEPRWVGARWVPLRGVDRLRLRMERAILTRVAEREAGVLVAMVTGSRGELDDDLRASFAANGGAHVLAVSGSHLTLLAGAVFWLLERVFRRVPRIAGRWGARVAAVAVTLPLVVCYVVLTGSPPSAARAGVMAVAVLLAELFGRKPAALHALFASAALLLAWQPFWLLDAGFQLSWAATLALMVSTQLGRSPMNSALRPGRLRRALRWLGGVVATSVAPSMFTAPIVLWCFGAIPLWGVLTNLVVVPALAVVGLPFGAAGALLEATVPSPVGAVLLWVAQMATRLSLWLGTTGSGVLEAPLVWGRPSVAGLLGWSLFGLAGLWSQRPCSGAFVGLSTVGLCVALLMDAPPWLSAPGALRISAIPVGQGDCTLVELPDGATLLVDSGGAGTDPAATGRWAVTPWLRGVGIARVDAVVATHGDLDHVGGIGGTIPPLPAAVYLTSAASLRPPLARVVAAGAIGAGARLVVPAPGRYRLNEVGWLDAPSRGLEGNDASLAMRVCHAGLCALLAGDAEAPREAELWARGGLRADVLKLSHHGSRTSSTPIFMDAVRPRLALAELGRDNRFGFPHPETLSTLRTRGIWLERTDAGRSVVIELGAAGVRVTDHRGVRWRRGRVDLGRVRALLGLDHPVGVVLRRATEREGTEEVHADRHDHGSLEADADAVP